MSLQTNNTANAEAGFHLLRGSVGIFLSNLLILPTGFITAVFLARRFGPAAYGLYALAARLILWIEWTHSSLFTEAAIKLVSAEADWRPMGCAIIRVHFLVSLAVAASLWLLAPFLARFLGEPVMSGYLRLFAVEIPICGLARSGINVMIARGLYRQRALINACRWTARLALIVLFVEWGLSVPGAILGSIGASLLEMLVSIFFVRECFSSKAGLKGRKFWALSTPLFLSSFSERFFRLDIFALKALGGTAAQAGFYGAAMNLTLPANLFSQSVSPPLLSTLNQLLAREGQAKADDIGGTTLRFIFCSLPLVAALAGCAEEIILLVFGSLYAPAVPVFALLIFAAWCLVGINLSRAMLTALGRPRLALLLSGPMAPLAIIGYLLAIPRLGGVGAAMVTLLVSAAGALASLLAVHRCWRIPLPLKNTVRSTFCAALSFGLAFFSPTPGYMLILKLAGIAIAIIIFYAFSGEITAEEIRLVKSLLQLRKGVKNHP